MVASLRASLRALLCALLPPPPPASFPCVMAPAELETSEAESAARGDAVKRAYVRRIFGEIAPRYDLLNHLLSFNIDRRWRDRAIGELGVELAPTGAWLDLCAGTLD